MTPCNEMEHYLELYSTRYYQMFDIDIFKDLTSSSESYLFIMLDPEHPLYKAIFDEFDSRETREYFYNERFIIGVVEPTGHGGASISSWLHDTNNKSLIIEVLPCFSTIKFIKYCFVEWMLRVQHYKQVTLG